MLTTHNDGNISDVQKKISLFYLFEKRSFDIFCSLMGLILVLGVSFFLFPFCLFGRNKGPLFLNRLALDNMDKSLRFINFAA